MQLRHFVKVRQHFVIVLSSKELLSWYKFVTSTEAQYT